MHGVCDGGGFLGIPDRLFLYLMMMMIGLFAKHRTYWNPSGEI
jgi:hypothetical protein